MNPCIDAAERLHAYLLNAHWNGQALIGPDPGIRFNYRIGRLIKSHLRGLPWRDSLYYLQAQGYWVLANLKLWALNGDERCRDLAVRCSEQMLRQQRDDGTWAYPNREWKGRIATAEGTWGSIGLIEAYRETGSAAFLEGALRWYAFLVDRIGFQRDGDELAVNYFADRGGARIPNNSITVLRFLAELSATSTVAAETTPLLEGLLTFIRRAQKPCGEFPYAIRGAEQRHGDRPHFQCYQYNAFACLNLIRYHELTEDAKILPMVESLLGFLRTGLSEKGSALFACGVRYPVVTYHTAVLGAAFSRAAQMGLDGYDRLADRATDHVLQAQRSDGSLGFSRGDYRVLTDGRSYPRYAAMTLYLLLAGSVPIEAP